MRCGAAAALTSLPRLDKSSQRDPGCGVLVLHNVLMHERSLFVCSLFSDEKPDDKVRRRPEEPEDWDQVSRVSL